MPFSLVILIVIAAASLVVAAYIYVTERSRRELVVRTSGRTVGAASLPLLETESQRRAQIREWIEARWTADSGTERSLVHAGFDDAFAPFVYVVARFATAVLFAFAAFVIAPQDQFTLLMSCVVAAGAVGFLLPLWFVRYTKDARQTRIRRGLPDALDLLVICVEAGTSLDAALLRVARDLGSAHPELARELLIVNRQTNAGMPRSDALHGLWERTGVEEIRAFVSHVVQAERWGTSSGRVLRVYAETLRRQRRQSAERKAATAPVKMLLPLGLFIFPAILLVVLGPVVLTVQEMFK